MKARKLRKRRYAIKFPLFAMCLYDRARGTVVKFTAANRGIVVKANAISFYALGHEPLYNEGDSWVSVYEKSVWEIIDYEG